MGDGGVACLPLQQQQHSIMDRFSIPDKALCGGKNGNGFNSKSLKLADLDRKKKMKVKKQELVKKGDSEKSELRSEIGGQSIKEVENSENSVEKEQKEEVEEGELGSLKWPRSEVENGEFLHEKSRRSEIEKGEIVSEKWRRGEVEKGEIVSGKWRRSEVEKGEIVPEKGRRGEAEKGEFGSWRGSEDEIEKGEFLPDRWQKVETMKDDYSYSSKIRRHESGKDKGWKCERQRTPPAGKYLADDVSSRKEFNRSGTQLTKCSSRWEIGQERNKRISSKIVNEEGSYKNEYSNGKNNNREYSSSNWLKRHGSDSDSSERKNHRDSGDYSTKSRKLSDDSNRPAHMEQYYRRSVDRPSRNSFSSRVFSGDKYSSRHYGSFPSSKDRHGRSPGHSEQFLSDRARYHGHRDRSPFHRQRSPHGRERSPYGRRRSPYDRSHHNDYRNRSPTHAEWSPQDRARYQDSRGWTPNHLEGSPLDRSKPNNKRETSGKPGANDKHYTPCGSKGQEEKHNQRDPNGRDSHFSAKESQDRSCVHTIDGSIEKIADSQSQIEEQSQSPSVNCKLSPHVDGVPFEEQPSMEEDMDICDTPPHVPVVVDSTAGRWFYLDHFGMECGPSKLCDLKALVDEGVLMPDHFIKHLDSDRWVTVENAASPLVTSNFPTIASECVTQLVTPPEAPGNLLADTVEPVQSGIRTGEETPLFCSDDDASVCGPMGNLHIDERVGALLDGFTVVPGRELETVGEVLQMTFEHAQLERWENSEGFTCHLTHTEEQYDKTDELSRYSDVTIIEATESRLSAPSEKDNAFSFADSGDKFSGLWSCKGGDWKRDDEGAQDKNVRKKLVLNDGFPLCQMPKSGYEDPRWQQKDELYFPSHSKRLDLPTWAFSLLDERNDGNGISRSTQTKPAVARGVKGTMLPVVRINACVVKDHGSFVSEPHAKVRSKERYSSRSARPYSTTSDVKRSLAEGNSLSKNDSEQDSLGSWKCNAPIKIPKDFLCRVSELQLHLGDWYHLDGAGHERGPSSFSELKVLADQGTIQKGSSVFRKFDNVWVPITSATETSEAVVKIQQENNATSGDYSRPLSNLQGAALSKSKPNYSSFHSLHPQFIGYTRGKLHELVMKSYKSREFAAAINEVLDPWINAKQPKKEVEKHIYWKSEGDARAGKRARLLLDESEDDYEMEKDLQTVQDGELTFEDLCGDATFSKEESACFEAEMGSWGLLDGRMLARIFHFLRSDMKSLAFASLTCKHWRSAERFYKGISRQVDLSSVGINCTDSIIRNITNGYNKEKITSMVLLGCANITSSTLADILGSFPCLSSIDIRGCSQFSELATKFPNVNWIKSKSSRGAKIFDEPHSRIRSLKQISEKTSVFRTKGSNSDMDDFSELKDYFDSVDRRDSANQLFHRSLYKRSKLFDARRSSSILSRDARMRRWAVKKSGNGYKRMEKFLASSLKDIMKENAFDFFVPKVAEIEERMKNGYYIGHGLNSVKEDISRMCRDAIKVKNRGDTGDMNRIITLFIQLATHLEESSKFSHERDEVIKSWKDDSAASAASKYKKLKKIMTDRKYSRSNGTSSVNGGFDYGEYASDREIKRRLSKLNKKSMDSGSETSDDLDMSSKDGKSDSESTVSDTESELDIRSEGRIRESRGDGYLEDVDALTDDREWGARMTKASLVPPVTRKYEVIDQYVTVADVEDVQRKMQVSLPEDYAEKLNAQKNGTEESDMELPEVKDYKPRKQLGHEVVEQEVYGIDPYTHNLILDSMPEESDWPLQEKHLFIEDVLLRTLNEQVRHFTGAGNTPMVYPLQPVIQEIERNADKNHDLRTMRLCQGILKAIDSRSDDNYVAYRKGLGVVCNKEGGFGEEDFVVEFLGEVYPAWKWFEKQDGIRSLQKNNKDPAPEFYNIYLERPKGDADGYDLVVVDAMHKANYASRICHSCRPNCEAKVTAVDGHYQIGIYTVRKIQYGEEITFDYNSVTESKDEYEASVCLCGSQVCRGSYLNLTGEGAFQKVLEEWHGILDRHQLMLESCGLNFVSEEDYIDLGRAGLGSCLLGGLPDWLIAYSARLVRFINFERTKLPEEILRHNLEEKRKYFLDICLEVEKSDAEVQAEGVYNQRLQNLALTLDKVRYFLRCVFGDPKKAPPPLEKLTPEAAVAFLWKGAGSLVEELLRCMAPHIEDEMLNDLKSKIQAHDPSHSDDIQKELQKSLLWLRDEVRNLPCTYKCRHDAAADLIHVYAYTKYFFRVHEYKAVTSPPVYISPLDLGPKYSDKLGAGLQEYTKIYGENYCLGQLIFWHIQTNAEPDCSLARASRGCLSLPGIDSFYAKVQKPSRHRVYGPRTVKFMVARMEKQPQRPWPTDRIWSFKNSPQIFGSPMMDAVLNNSPLDREMVHWLKNRPAIFEAMWDR